MIGAAKYRPFLRHPGYNKKDSAPPDYTPMANASKESAEIMAGLGREQLDFAKQQYAESKPLYDRLVDSQIGISEETARQGQDYYDYMVSRQRPVEDYLNYEAMGLNADEIAQVEAMRQQENQAYQSALSNARSQYSDLVRGWTSNGGTAAAFDPNAIKDVSVPGAQYAAPTGISDIAYLGLLQAMTGSDPRAVTNQSEIDAALLQNKINAQLRDALSAYGTSGGTSAGANGLPSFDSVFGRISADNSGSTSLLNKLAAAAADRNANVAGDKAAADIQAQVGRQYDQAARAALRYGIAPGKLGDMTAKGGVSAASAIASGMNQARDKEKALGYAKKMDVAGLYRGLPGASQGAYGLALNAGNSAGQNQAAPGAQYMQGMAQGASTIGSGRQMYQQGLGTILNSQTQLAMQDNDSGLLGGVGSVMGGLSAMKTAGIFSDRRLKENVEPVGETAHGLTLYEFNYRGDDVRYLGVMADEVEAVMPAAVTYNEEGYAMVDYDMLGIAMEKA